MESPSIADPLFLSPSGIFTAFMRATVEQTPGPVRVSLLVRSRLARCDSLEISPSWWGVDEALLANTFHYHGVHHGGE